METTLYPTEATPRSGGKQTDRYLTHKHTPSLRGRPLMPAQPEPQEAALALAGGLRHGWLGAAPLAGAPMAQDKGRRVALFAGTCLSQAVAL